MSTTAHQPGARERDDPADQEPRFPAPEEAIFRLRQRVFAGDHWFEALLDAVGSWRAPEERVGDRHYRYLIGGEAFDWLLLAERILGELTDVVPQREATALLFDGLWPIDVEDADFARRLGPAKHSAHLNYLYGVLVEEALQLSVEEEIHKENRCKPWGQDDREEGSMFRRVYGLPLFELRATYYEETGVMLPEELPYADWKAFNYWLFKLRLKRQDRARVASDTRKGLAQLSRMELAVSERRHGTTLGEADFAARFGP
ncbi:MAG: hypothetical protein IT304_09175 [Dehalococcoidia bacterium]|nr:hypothetical protein [Dehalococcoidia bacterium]